MMEKIKNGDYILLYFDNRRKWLINVDKNKKFHTHKGIVDLERIIGLSYGEFVESSLGYRFWILVPSICNFLSAFERPTQIIYPKDAGLIILKLGIASGKRIIEAGTGSGSLTAIMAQLVKPNGHLYTYDINSRFLNFAKRNVRKTNAIDFVTFENLDAKEGFKESDVDAIMIDLADPWNIIPGAYNSLKGGSPLGSFSPTINQVEKTVLALRSNCFINTESIECLVREMHIEKGKSRPTSRMIAHTGYLTFANKIISD